MSNPHLPYDVAERVQRIENNVLLTDTFRNLITKRPTLIERMNVLKVPGVSVAVINDYQVEWARGYGVLEMGKPETVNTNTLFQCASISKPVAAVAALRLVERGFLDLDEDVNEKLVSWHVPPTIYMSKQGRESWQPRITIRQLVSHTAGLTVHGFPGYAYDEPLPSFLNILDGTYPANTSAIRVDTLPGLQYRYSGGGYCVLRQLLCEVTGKPFPALMRELVLDPLGMHESTYEQPLPDEWTHNAASAHRTAGKPIPGKWHTYPEMAPDGLWSTPSDLARFCIALQLANAGKENALLSSAMMQQMFTSQALEQGMNVVGLGVFLYGEGETARFGHTGGNEGIRCEFIAYQNRGQGAIVMTNSDEGWPIIQDLLATIVEEYAWPDYRPAQPTPINFSAFTPYVGEYKVKTGLQFTIAQHDEQLFLQFLDQPAIQLFPLSETRYFMEAINSEIVFEKDSNDSITKLIFKQNGRSISAKKKR